MPHISYHLGNGANTFLWFDHWYNNRPLCSCPQDSMISHDGLPKDSRVALILHSSSWVLPRSNYHELLLWKLQFDYATPFNLLLSDSIKWDGIACKRLKLYHIWDSIRSFGNPCAWASSVWHKISVPRYSFHHWLIMLNRIPTLSKLFSYRTVTDTHCYFCISGFENQHHLFLECPYVQKLLNLLIDGRLAAIPFSENGIADSITLHAIPLRYWLLKEGSSSKVDSNLRFGLIENVKSTVT
ncbi:hypothetical protein POM88_035765 [Heracleum sosnowskyi]|uniref:Reverse transcriptase zinc-binding domain-containing protein n=1 Tax=Heracleum sosnowskyi TaxID=360622 RepID=A0AAD8HNV0_9APIA|nr:hypothetical protein POM88_035765 [Heracleum sosnowskyi]